MLTFTLVGLIVKEQHDAHRAFNGSSQGIEADGYQVINLYKTGK
jgi:hypothetical protein